MDGLSRADMVLSEKKKGHRTLVVMKLRLQSPSKATLFDCVQNFTSFFVLETARSVVLTAQRGQNNCTAAHARSLEGTLATGSIIETHLVQARSSWLILPLILKRYQCTIEKHCLLLYH